MLVVLLKELQAGGGRLCMASVQELVALVLRIAAVDQVLDVYDTVEAAERTIPPAAAGQRPSAEVAAATSAPALLRRDRP